MCGPLYRFGWAGALALCLFVGRAWAEETPVARALAPGVLTVIPADVQPRDTFSDPAPIAEIVSGMPDLDWTPNFAPKSDTLRERAQRVVFRRPVWGLEFAFKPLRMIAVDIPQPTGKMQRKLIWYLVYRVKNNGYDIKPVGTADRWGQTLYVPEYWNYKTLRFFPHMVLKSLESDEEYLDRVLPAGQRAIQQREKLTLLNSIEISRVQIPLSDEQSDHSVWGVAMWEDVDPRIDFFAIFVGGLTNAFQVENPPGPSKPGEPAGTGRVFRRKTLQLNFWRPGDTIMEHEEELRYGAPLDPDPRIQQELLKKYGLKEPLDYLWVYR